MNTFFPSLLPSVGLLFSHVFMWSNNAHMFSNSSIAVSFLVVFAVSSAVFCINYFLMPKFIQIFFQNRWHKLLFYIYISCIFSFLMLCVVDYTIFNQRKMYAPIFAFIAFIICYMNFSKILTIFLSIMLLFSSIILIKNSIFEEEYIFHQKNLSITLKKKPNIYLYWLESYQDFDSLRRVYNIDSEEYKQYLYDKKFFIGENIFSSGPYTLIAFTQLYSCSGTEKIMGNMDVLGTMRELIGGDENNFVLRTLKKTDTKQ